MAVIIGFGNHYYNIMVWVTTGPNVTTVIFKRMVVRTVFFKIVAVR